jgi:hypothetical protein
VGFDAVVLMLMGYEIFGLFSSADLFHIIPMTILQLYSGFHVQRNSAIAICTNAVVLAPKPDP